MASFIVPSAAGFRLWAADAIPCHITRTRSGAEKSSGRTQGLFEERSYWKRTPQPYGWLARCIAPNSNKFAAYRVGTRVLRLFSRRLECG